MGTASAPPRLAALMVAAAALLFFARLGATDLWAPDEPRYGQIAAELHSMRHGASGLVLLHLNDQPYTQKPPLYYWLAAAAGCVFGRVTESAARLPSALAGLALVVLTWRFGRRLLGASSGLLGAAFLATTWEFATRSRRVQLDALLALFETLALVAFWRLERGLGSRRTNLLLLHGAMGLAVLTKGPVGVLVPLAVMAASLAWERRLGTLARLFPPWALMLSLGPGLAWIVAAVALAPPGFFAEAVGENVFGRFFAGTSHARPAWYYLYAFPVDLLPWTPLGVAVAWAARRRVFVPGASQEARQAWRFLLAWVAATLVFFSLSSGKRGLYLLPAFPAAALLIADATLRWVAAQPRFPLAFSVGAASGGTLLAAAAVWLALADPVHDATVSRATGAAVLLAVSLAAVAWTLARRRGAARLTRVAIAVAAVWAVELALFAGLFPARNPEKSPRPLAEAAARLVGPGEPVGLLQNRALTGGLVYYGGHRVANLAGPKSVARFFAEGGRAVVMRESSLERVRERVPVEVRFRVRGGHRAMLVVTPAPAVRE